MKFIRLSILLSISALLMSTSLLLNVSIPETAEAAPTDITCNNGYSAMTYASGLSSPDGLAMSPDGLVYVAEEGTGEVTRINADTTQTAVLTGLSSPEGIAFDAAGNLYVVEDKEDGRLIRQDTSGVTTTLANDLLAPEGIVVADDGTIYVTESGLQIVGGLNPEDIVDLSLIDAGSIDLSSIDPADFQIITDTLVSRIEAFASTSPFTRTTVITATPEYTPTIIPTYSYINTPFGSFPVLEWIDIEVTLDFLSFSGITVGNNDNLYVSAELSNLNTTQMTTTNYTVNGTPLGDVLVRNVTVETKSTRSVLQVIPSTGVSITHVNNLTATEGIRFLQSGQYPLHIVQEDISGVAESGIGRLDIAASDGTTSVLCEGFKTIEDVLIGPDGVIYVSEDGTNSIIKLTPSSCSPVNEPSSLDLTYTDSLTLTWAENNSYDYMVWQSAIDPYVAPNPIGCQLSGSCTLVETGNSVNQPHAPQQFFTVSAIDSCGATAVAPTNVGIIEFSLEPGN